MVKLSSIRLLIVIIAIISIIGWMISSFSYLRSCRTVECVNNISNCDSQLMSHKDIENMNTNPPQTPEVEELRKRSVEPEEKTNEYESELKKFLESFNMNLDTFKKLTAVAEKCKKDFPPLPVQDKAYKNIFHQFFYRVMVLFSRVQLEGDVKMYDPEGWGIPGWKQADTSRVEVDQFFDEARNDIVEQFGSEKELSCLEVSDLRYTSTVSQCKTRFNLKFQKNSGHISGNNIYLDLDSVVPEEMKNKFDVVVFTQVFEHVKDIVRFCKSTADLMKKDGLAIVTGPTISKFHPGPEDNYRITLSGLYHLMHREGGLCAKRLKKYGNLYTAVSDMFQWPWSWYPDWMLKRDGKEGLIYTQIGGVFRFPSDVNPCDFVTFPMPLDERKVIF